jgi:type II secretory pathway component PulM
MDLRLLAGVFCGSALTLAVVSFADAPRAQSPCTMQVADINARLSEMEKNLATMPTLSSDVSALKAADTANVKWQRDAVQKLDEISKNLLLFFH